MRKGKNKNSRLRLNFRGLEKAISIRSRFFPSLYTQTRARLRIRIYLYRCVCVCVHRTHSNSGTKSKLLYAYTHGESRAAIKGLRRRANDKTVDERDEKGNCVAFVSMRPAKIKSKQETMTERAGDNTRAERKNSEREAQEDRKRLLSLSYTHVYFCA